MFFFIGYDTTPLFRQGMAKSPLTTDLAQNNNFPAVRNTGELIGWLYEHGNTTKYVKESAPQLTATALHEEVAPDAAVTLANAADDNDTEEV